MENQVLYQGRWVSRNNFRVFVYNDKLKKLANSYDEYSRLIESGLWFPSENNAEVKQPTNIRKIRKPKDGANS